MKILYAVTFLLIGLSACKDNDTTVEKINEADLNDKSAQEELSKPQNSLPSIDGDIVQNLAMNCDYVDYIFYDLPISISQDNKQAIISNINFISRATVPDIPINCKPMGRKFYHVDGEIILEADIYLNKDEGCFFYVFLENEKQSSANKISKEGINFYYNVFKQAGIK